VFILLARVIFLVPRLLPLFILAAAFLETARISTGYALVDEFSARFVYFLMGLWLAPVLLPGGRKGPRGGVSEPLWLTNLRAQPTLLASAILLWAVIQGALAVTNLDALRGVSLLSGFAGAAALLTIGLWLVRTAPQAGLTRFLMLVGQRSIVIYLVFTLPMAAIREGLIRFGPPLQVDVVSLLVIIGAVLVSLAVERAARQSWLAPLFERRMLDTSAKGETPPRA
jgi:peptidoglycan/LPS O-acetylase OafA/YrhL